MAESLEFWAFVISNLIVLGFGSVLALLSYRTYWNSHRNKSFRDATVGFILITLSGLLEPVYSVAIQGSYELTPREMLIMQAVEGVVMGAGLAVLFYSITRYRSG